MWRISVDTGGTFTDAFATAPDGAELRTKLLSSGILRASVVEVIDSRSVIVDRDFDATDGVLVGFSLPANRARVSDWKQAACMLCFDQAISARIGDTLDLSTGEEVPVIAARILTSTPADQEFPALDFRLATTRGTNALLESKGAPPLVVLPEGLGDLLEIGDQRRPELFALRHEKHRLPLAGVVEVTGRLDADGDELEPIDTAQIDRSLSAIDPEAPVAIALLHSFRNPAHERALADRLRHSKRKWLSISSELAPALRLLPRVQTAVADAYLAPIMDAFTESVADRLGTAFSIMTSAGGLLPSTHFRPKDGLLSGPAGGLVGAQRAATMAGIDKFIAFDMGGTSTDVARVEDGLPYVFEKSIAGVSVLAPSLQIETVAAGGGSICALRGEGLTVGPESAGASPGPACYGQGGPLTLTDVNLLLGRIDATRARIPLDHIASQRALDLLKIQMTKAGMAVPEERELLTGLLAIGIGHMADAIRRISLLEGYDPADHALIAFGGAGPQHACELATVLGMRTILIPADAGLLSARGLAHARVEHFATRTILKPLAEIADQLDSIVVELKGEACALHSADDSELEIHHLTVELRLKGQESHLSVDLGGIDEMSAAFARRFEDLFGYPPPPNRPLEIVQLQIGAATRSNEVTQQTFRTIDPPSAEQVTSNPFFTLVSNPSWRHQQTGDGGILLESEATTPITATAQDRPLEIEIVRHRMNAIVAEMGALLKRCAISTNVREREDFSCALLDADGQLAINAPHIPVHLGALGLCVREVIKAIEIGPGDLIVTNHPGFGGSHLPDVTVIGAAFDADGNRIGYLANRAHHAEIGGMTPGSMPPAARRLSDEGVVIAPCYLFKGGEPQFETIEERLSSGPWPTRNLADNMADLQAQAAAARFGIDAIEALGAERCRPSIRSLLERSANAAKQCIAKLDFTSRSAVQRLDDGSPICLSVERDADGLSFDFAGTAATLNDNLNATPAIVRSAILYVLRLMVNEDLPLNEGLLENVRIKLPPCFLNPEFPSEPSECPAVVGGNVETSQRIVDTAMQALQLQAGSQGTMNNLLFGNDAFGYYETIAGGAGAGDGYDGASALHTHMTNTAITDPETLEWRYPVRLREFSVRRGSGGVGAYRGGEGCVREFELLAPLTVSILAEHRVVAPFGQAGGGEGACGRQILIHPNGREEQLDGRFSGVIAAGSRIRIETPGGGGYGA